MSFPDISNLLVVYEESLNGLIENLGKDVKLFFKPTRTVVSEQDIDINRQDESMKPSWKTAEIEAETENSTIIKGLLEYNPRDFIRLGEKAQVDDSVVKIKTYIANLDDLIRCEYIVPDFSVTGQNGMRYKMYKTPILSGLAVSKYCITYWQRSR